MKDQPLQKQKNKDKFCPKSLQQIKVRRSLGVRNEDNVLSIQQLGSVSPLHRYPSPARLLCAAAAASCPPAPAKEQQRRQEEWLRLTGNLRWRHPRKPWELLLHEVLKGCFFFTQMRMIENRLWLLKAAALILTRLTWLQINVFPLKLWWKNNFKELSVSCSCSQLLSLGIPLHVYKTIWAPHNPPNRTHYYQNKCFIIHFNTKNTHKVIDIKMV